MTVEYIHGPAIGNECNPLAVLDGLNGMGIEAINPSPASVIYFYRTRAMIAYFSVVV